MPRKLFISYRSSDAAKVDKIAKDLTLLKYDDGTPRYSTWQDKHNLPPASPNWWDAIVDAIIDCDIFVFNLSRASLQSDVCRAELDYAYQLNLPVIPIVLDGEFFLNEHSGKYDLPKETWALVPERLREAQLLFYVGTDFYGRFEQAVGVFERNWPRRLTAKRPLTPDTKSLHGSNHALYDAACDYAERLAFADAEKHFSALVLRNDSDYAEVAAQWLELLRLYAELVEIDERRSAAFIFGKKWGTYTGLFPKEFLEGIFDPKGFAARATHEAEAAPAPLPAIRKLSKPRIIDLLPAPFAWVEIPKKGYSIAKYPVTNTQFAKFIDAGGYDERKWWTDAGWEAKLKGWAWDEKKREWSPTNNAWTQTRFWQDSKWNGAEQPVVGVSWFEAVAFCLWLSDVTGEKIMLSTEDQWQYAAQGDDGRKFSWGNEWDCPRCNNSVEPCVSNVTTPVRQYQGKGDSAFGVVDMAGNVWEWCLTGYDNNTNDITSNAKFRGVRGGSWNVKERDMLLCDYRISFVPHNRINDGGFRLSLS